VIGAEFADQRWRELLTLVERHLPIARRRFSSGDRVQVADSAFKCLHIVNLGACKTVNLAADGNEQVVGLHFKGDWIGFDGIATGHCASDAYAMDTGELWSLRYDELLQAAVSVPTLMHAVFTAMSFQMAHDRDRRLTRSLMSADARVADFVRSWADSLAERDLRCDQITLRMTRAEIGSYLGLTLETVSRALTRLARCGLIGLDENRRRNIAIPSVTALVDFVQRTVSPPEAISDAPRRSAAF
jgi:CRP/FNR family transcriptional regulator, anaerobic regulatory protein